jgi:hypothetical protein
MMLDGLSKARDGRSKRVSSYDVTGGNADCWPVAAGDNKLLADIKGAGVIRHIWFTISCNMPDYPRRLVLRMFWDGQRNPCVEVPVGDFFGIGHGKLASFSSAVLNMSAWPGNDRNAAMNCYFPMPFADGARIEVENQGAERVDALYFYIDYDQLDRLPADQLRFHAWWNRNNPCQPPTHQGSDPDVNLTDADNYLLMQAEGRGHYVGCNLSVHNLYGGWWGEGDDMIMVDGAKWPPDLHGTGSEDYFNHAWGMQFQNAYIYNGVSYHKPGAPHDFNQRIAVYRYHVNEPVVFTRSIRVSIEHGHANDRCDDYSSTAYWYQTLPSKLPAPIPPMEARLPRPDATVYPVDLPIPPRDRQRSGSPIDPRKLR